MNILIATGIYPPQVGGISEYAVNFERELKSLGHNVTVSVFDKRSPFRHLLYALRNIKNVYTSDYILSLDTFSVGFPIMCVCKLLRKKYSLRIGGDFLWESYMSRNGVIKLSDFYIHAQLSFKEKIIRLCIDWVIDNAEHVYWTTSYQRDLMGKQGTVIGNYYGQKEISTIDNGVYMASGRNVPWKNTDILRQLPYVVDTTQYPHEMFMEKIKTCHAVILPSISDISPNVIFQAIRFGKPFIMTYDTGIYDLVKDIGIFIDPQDVHDIQRKIELLNNNYEQYRNKVVNFPLQNTWYEMTCKCFPI